MGKFELNTANKIKADQEWTALRPNSPFPALAFVPETISYALVDFRSAPIAVRNGSLT